MPTPLSAPNPLNYTFGAQAITAGGVDLGNVVTASIDVEAAYLDRYSARLGRRIEDPGVLRSLDIRISVVIDEPNKVNLQRMLMTNDASSNKIGFAPQAAVPVVFTGIPLAGNNFEWTIPKAFIRPAGGFGLSDDSWMTLPLTIIPEWDATDGYGGFTATGVNV